MHKKNLNIAVFTDTYLPQVNGVVRSIETFRHQLERRGHTVYIFAPSMSAKSKREGNVFRFRAAPYAFQPEYRFALPFSRQLLRDFPELQIDVVHAQTPISLGVVGSWVAKIKRVPLVFTYHTLYAEYIKTYFSKRLKKLSATPKVVAKITSFYCNRCNAVIAPSKKIEDLVKGYGVRRDIHVIPTGIDLEKFVKDEKIDIRGEYNIPRDTKVLVCTARLGKEKNLDFLIKSFALANRKMPNTYLVFMGGGPAEAGLKKLAASLGMKNVVFTGYLSHEKVIQVLFASDLFVFSSLTETQGIVLAEAVACGLPLVVVDDKALRDMAIDNVNAVVTPVDTSQFSAAIVDVLTDKERYNELAANNKKVIQEFTAEKTTDKLVEVYNQCLLDKANKNKTVLGTFRKRILRKKHDKN